MARIKLDSATHFVVDYRSAPSGVGSIFFSDNRITLVTESDCGPKDLKEAERTIKAEYIPTEVEHIPMSMGENWEEGNQALGDILKKNDVQYVVDTELAYEFGDYVENMFQCVFTIYSWCKLRQIKL